MNWLDLGIIIFLLVSLIRGREVGFVRQFFSTIGFFAGLLLGAWLQGKLITIADTPASKAVLVLFVVLGCALAVMVVGEYVGLRLKFKLRETPLINKFDKIFGSVLAAVTILAAVWLGAAMFRNVPNEGLQRQISNSRVVNVLNDVLPSAPNLVAELGHLINPNSFPQVFTGAEPQLQSDEPLPELGELRPAVEAAHDSTIKIRGEGCGGIVEGSGFVAADELVVTNAHVVAGVADPQVIDVEGGHRATVVWFDPNLDLAILRVGGDLAGDALPLELHIAENGTAAVVLGYPQRSGFTADPAIVVDSFTARGRDIYNQNTTEREVYSVRADIRQGNSGGPLVNADGEVIGVIFAQSTNYSDVGYALTANQAAAALDRAEERTQPVNTGSCAS